ncbi:MAG: hypothetical protein KBT48_10295, partial [Firmicutes bacterium]|nr:hypothetical protein [Bacillota bacterium]
MEKLKQEVERLLIVCDRKIRPQNIDVPSIKSALVKEISNYLYYLSASDGMIHEKEKRFLNALVDKDLTLKDMAGYIQRNNIYTKEFEQKLPEIYKCLLNDPEDAKLYIDVFSKIGKEFIVIDSKAD